MKKIKKVLLALLTFALIWCAPLSSAKTGAAVNYKKLYKNFLKKSSVVTVSFHGGKYRERIYPRYFALVDVNKDGIKELIIAQDKSVWDYYVFTVKKRKVQFAGYIINKYGAKNKYGVGRITYNKKKRGLIALYGGSGCSGNGFFVMKNGKLKETHETCIFYNRKTTYEYNYKPCSKKKHIKCYNAYFNRIKNRSHFVYYDFIKKTNKNIAKKLG